MPDPLPVGLRRMDSRSPRRAKPRPPQQARSHATRAKILSAAVQLVEAQGFEQTSMAQIARKANIGMGTLYHHMPDKRALLLELMQQWTERWEEERRSELRVESFMRGDPRTFLAGFLRNIYERMQDRNWIHVEMTLLAQRDDELRERFQNLRSAGAERLATILEVGREQGFLRAQIDPMSAALLLNNALEFLVVHIHMLRRPPRETERILEELTEMVCCYLVGDS